jgi:predicted nucleic acid-binding protein
VMASVHDRPRRFRSRRCGATVESLTRALDLQDRVRVLDGLYVVLAQDRNAELVTTDRRLGRDNSQSTSGSRRTADRHTRIRRPARLLALSCSTSPGSP